ncbi:hypothetical protein [Cellulosilyticum ruminicola]|uniref:hypothetical protein n=1 Tax=Cellulosilyticum ruminicola TaxID=425254 RepID=UPI0006D017F7|nr:hypothetical protein [Cellulosilyticum ruminicola]
MGKRRKYLNVMIIILFLLSFYFVEYGVAGSNIVAGYNHGYGTFDMKHYDPSKVACVLSEMSPKGIMTYRWYYVFDFIFIGCLLAIQCMCFMGLFSWWNSTRGKIMVCSIPVLRGLFDMIENIILLNTLFTFPKVNDTVIRISMRCTYAKLWLVKLWLVELIISIVLCIIIKKRKVKED